MVTGAMVEHMAEVTTDQKDIIGGVATVVGLGVHLHGDIPSDPMED